jgi:hypothetical protein
MGRRASIARFCFKSPLPLHDVTFVQAGFVNFGVDHPALIVNPVEMLTVD